MTEILDNLPPAVLLVLVLLLVVWLVLLLLVPFMIESIRGWTRKSYVELEQLNKKVDRLIVLLSERADADLDLPAVHPIDRPAREPRAERVRKEPTISG
jgi:hypothetical protein